MVVSGSQPTWRYDTSKTRIQADFQVRQPHFGVKGTIVGLEATINLYSFVEP